MLKVSHAKPLHDATALMADEARMRNRQSVHMARMRCGARDSAVLGGLVQGELWQSECFEVLGIEVLSNSIPTIVGSA